MVELYLKFPGEASYSSYSHLLIDRSLRIDEQIMSKRKTSCVDSAFFSLKHSNEFISKIAASSSDILCYIAEQGSPVFTGKVANNFGQDIHQIKGHLNVEAVDNSYVLDEKLKYSFQYPDLVGDPGYFIFNSADQNRSIIHLLLNQVGLSALSHAEGIPDINQRILHISGTKGDETYRSLLDDLLFEFGYCFYFDRSGKFSLYKWLIDSPVPTFQLSNQYCVSGTKLSYKRHERAFDGMKVVWSETGVVEGARLYDANLPISSQTGECTGESVLGGLYYPEDAEWGEVWQPYVKNWLDTPYLTFKTREKNRDISLIASSGHTIDCKADPEVIMDTEVYESLRGRVRFHNTATTPKNIYYLAIYGTALVRKDIRESICPAESDNPEEYTSRFIFDQVSAEHLSQALANSGLFGEYEFTWSMREELELGQIISIDIADTLINTTAQIWGKKHLAGSTIWEYTAVSISVFSSTKKTQILDSQLSDSLRLYYSGQAIETVKNQLFAMADDGIVTSQEKIGLKSTMSELAVVHTILLRDAEESGLYGRQSIASYISAYDQLKTYVDTILATADNSVVDKVQYVSLWDNYWAAKLAADRTISDARTNDLIVGAGSSLMAARPDAFNLGDKVSEVSIIADGTVVFVGRDDMHLYRTRPTDVFPAEKIIPVVAMNPAGAGFDAENLPRVMYTNKEDGDRIYLAGVLGEGNGVPITANAGYSPRYVGEDEFLYLSASGFLMRGLITDALDGSQVTTFPIYDFSVKSASEIVYANQMDGSKLYIKSSLDDLEGTKVSDIVSADVHYAKDNQVFFRNYDDDLNVYQRDISDVDLLAAAPVFNSAHVMCADEFGNVVFGSLLEESTLYSGLSDPGITGGFLEARPNEFLITGDILSGSRHIKNVSPEHLDELSKNDNIYHSALPPYTKVAFKGPNYILLNKPAIRTAAGATVQVAGTRVVLDANRVIVDGSITADLLEVGAINSKARTTQGTFKTEIDLDKGSYKFRKKSGETVLDFDPDRKDLFPDEAELQLTGTMSSSNFLSGFSGWEINENGDAEFSSGEFRGNCTFSGILNATAGVFGGFIGKVPDLESLIYTGPGTAYQRNFDFIIAEGATLSTFSGFVVQKIGSGVASSWSYKTRVYALTVGDGEVSLIDIFGGTPSLSVTIYTSAGHQYLRLYHSNSGPTFNYPEGVNFVPLFIPIVAGG